MPPIVPPQVREYKKTRMDARGRKKTAFPMEKRSFWTLANASGFNFGGEGGIRTLGDVATTPDFESGTFDHSATSPHRGISNYSDTFHYFQNS